MPCHFCSCWRISLGGTCKFGTHYEHTHSREAFSINFEQEVDANQSSESVGSVSFLPFLSPVGPSAGLFAGFPLFLPLAALFLKPKRPSFICSQCAKAGPKAHCRWKNVYAKKYFYCHVFNNACLPVRTSLFKKVLYWQFNRFFTSFGTGLGPNIRPVKMLEMPKKGFWRGLLQKNLRKNSNLIWKPILDYTQRKQRKKWIFSLILQQYTDLDRLRPLRQALRRFSKTFLAAPSPTGITSSSTGVVRLVVVGLRPLLNALFCGVFRVIFI